MPAPWPESIEESEAKRPRVATVAVRSGECRRSIQSAGGLCWSSADLALAATLLETPNARFPTVTFSNLEEKRRVFTLVYDVLRYKSILNQALNDLYFFTRYPHLKERCHLVWLLFFDLYKRDFALRDPLDSQVEAAFVGQGLVEIDEVLWQLRVKLAATVSRLRIKSGAHSLSKLLPRHLRLTRTALEENIVTGWVNIFKTSVRETCDYLDGLGISPLPRDRDVLEPFTFKMDHLLPRFLHMMPRLREDLVESPLVTDHHIIMQERTFCLGPAVMAQLLKDFALSGKVAQTHVNSPITTAYFANLLINNDKIETLLVFGAGYRKEACEQYLRDLGVKNTHVYSESFAGLAAESRVLDNVIAVLATPPNTNSSVVDPVDLAVARGGDLRILQQLTDDDFASTPKGEHINKYVRDQRDTLRRAMSKPQIQFVVYETHSRFICENEEMASTLVNDLNNYALEVHLEELRRSQGESQEQGRSQTEPSDSQLETPVIRVDEDLTLPTPTPVQSVVIPPSDLFELADLPDLCPNFENCLDLMAEGTYIALIKRKEITRLDPKYMIQMAEARGLFGRPDNTPKVKNTGERARAKAALAALQARSDLMAEKNKNKVKVEMDRIAAPTRASLMRDVHPPSSKDCPRHTHHLAHDGTPSLHPVERKTYLTASEEEELISRLYTCPRVNVFPPRLYEDLPPLKFWDSPASVIESYLQRKVFQRRLQLAYEFNQSKPESEFPRDSSGEAKLSQALMQLTSDMRYFEQLASHRTVRLAHQREAEVAQTAFLYQNKALWDQITFSEGNETSDEENKFFQNENTHVAEEKSLKLFNEIKKRYFTYKDFYKIQNVRPDDKEPLALTIGQIQSQESSPSTGQSVSFSEIKSKTQIARKVLVNPVTEEKLIPTSIHKDSLVSGGRLPKISKCTSLDSLRSTDMTQRFHCLSDAGYERESLLPCLTNKSFLQENNFGSHRNTVGTLRDSFVLTQERLSKVGRFSLVRNKSQFSHISLVSHRDSYTLTMSKKMVKRGRSGSFPNPSHISESSVDLNKPKINMSKSVYDDDNSASLIDHQDSVVLALDRLTTKENITSKLSCDVCNNRYEPIKFMCSFHAEIFHSKPFKAPGQSIISKNMSYLRDYRKDSVEVMRKRMSGKEKKQSVAVQTQDVGIKKIISPTKELSQIQTNSLKDSKDSKKSDLPKKSEDVSSSLTNYIMKSIQIKQIDPHFVNN